MRERAIPDKPDQAFGCCVLFRFQLVEDEVLEGFGLSWSGQLSVSDFLVLVRANLVV